VTRRAGGSRGGSKAQGGPRAAKGRVGTTGGVGPKSGTGRSKSAGSQSELVKELLKKVEEKLGSGEVKATLGDYIRLVQLQKELDEEEPREIHVTWVEPAETTTEKYPESGGGE